MRKFTKEISALLAATAMSASVCIASSAETTDQPIRMSGQATVADQEVQPSTIIERTAGVATIADEEYFPPEDGVAMADPEDLTEPTEAPVEFTQPIGTMMYEEPTTEEFPPTAGVPLPPDDMTEPTEEIPPLAGDVIMNPDEILPTIKDTTGTLPDEIRERLAEKFKEMYPNTDLSDFTVEYAPDPAKTDYYPFNVYYKDILVYEKDGYIPNARVFVRTNVGNEYVCVFKPEFVEACHGLYYNDMGFGNVIGEEAVKQKLKDAHKLSDSYKCDIRLVIYTYHTGKYGSECNCMAAYKVDIKGNFPDIEYIIDAYSGEISGPSFSVIPEPTTLPPVDGGLMPPDETEPTEDIPPLVGEPTLPDEDIPEPSPTPTEFPPLAGLPLPSDEEIKPTLRGDADLNGFTELADLTTVAKYVLNKTAFPLASDTAKANADMNGDGVIDGLDISMLIEDQLGKQRRQT